MTDRDLNEIDSKQIVLHIGGSTLGTMDPFVFDMHTKNGLLEDCLKSKVYEKDADAEMVEWIKKYTSGDHIPLAGSGVSHFDRQYIKKDLPRFNKFLSYWAYDSGVIRRTLKLFGIDASFADTTDDKTHRALDDIRAHVEEMRRYKRMFQSWDIHYTETIKTLSKGWPG